MKSSDRFPPSRDVSRMAELLGDFPRQIRDGIRIGKAFPLPRSLGKGVEKILFVGMGGSAIGGDVIRCLVKEETPRAVWVWRHYALPPFADSRSLCIFSSYSGNTEETLSAFREGIKRKIPSLTLTSGGELARLSERHSIPWIPLPKGLPPRCALGYLVFPLWGVLARLNLLSWNGGGAEEAISVLEALQKKFRPEVPFVRNPAKQLASFLKDRWAVLYAGTELLEAAALRLRGQIQENAKAMASHHLLPEMNHNEILGWQFPKSLSRKAACVFLRDRDDHPRIKLRFDFTKNLLVRERRIPVREIDSKGRSPVARLFSVIHLGDWVSYFLALLYGIDPTPVTDIEALKKHLSKR